MTITAKRKREMQADGVKFGRHVELDEGETPDDCVIDASGYLFLEDCIHAKRHRTREDCPHWREIVEIEKDVEK